jgi:hypothetical protein
MLQEIIDPLSSSAKADEPVLPGISGFGPAMVHRYGEEYWVPAFAGKTTIMSE